MKHNRQTQAERRSATRAALVAAGRRLFAKDGFAAVGTEQVVREAGVTRGALYHHFADKQALFAAVFEAVESELIARIGEAMAAAPGADPLDAMRRGAAVWLDVCREPEVHRIALIDGPAVLGWAGWREIGDRYSVELVRQALQAAIAAGRIPVQPVAPLAHVLLGMVREGALYLAMAPEDGRARREVGEAIDRIILGLGSAASSR
jgi:AcrR family transcriptional regulator